MSSIDFTAVRTGVPLIAILRGLQPGEAEAVGEALVAGGIYCIEVPLNSPEACRSIELLRGRLGARAFVGAGTVLTLPQVHAVAAAGAQFVVSPNLDEPVVAATRAAGMNSLPGVFTASEAFRALAAGADALKLFPAEAAPPAMLRALRAVLPAGCAVFPVGGVEPANMAAYRAAGASGFGIGSALFRPGVAAEEVARRAARFVAAWHQGA